MRGKHRVIVKNNKLHYEFEIKRNVTVIQGDSATGKTTLVDLIQTYGRYGQESGIMMTSDVPCVAFSGDAGLWKTVLDAYENSIIFFDEDYDNDSSYKAYTAPPRSYPCCRNTLP